MKKTFITLAILAATGAASADSSVTLYGRFDLGLSSKETVTSNGKNDQTSYFGAHSQRTVSRLGVSGTENLGSGITAGFNYEFSIHPDNTGPNTSSVGSTRLANLTLDTRLGNVVVGTFLNPFDDVEWKHTHATRSHGGSLADAGIMETRSKNSLQYTTKNFHGLTASLTLMSDEGSEAKNNSQILAVNYENGPMSAIVAYGSLEIENNTTNSTKKDDQYGLSVSYALDMAVPYIQYLKARSETDQQDRTAYEIGSKFPVGAFTPYISLGELTSTSTVNNQETKHDYYEIGSTYDLSKRTYTYISYGEKSAKDSVEKVTALDVGLVHKF